MMDQQNRKKVKYRNLWSYLFAVLTLCAALSLLGDLTAWILHCMGGISFSVNRAATVGIIGGADGPTAVFVTASTSPFWYTVFKFLFLMIGILGWRHLKQNHKSKGEE